MGKNTIIDMRSDTVTLPTCEMLDAITKTPLGDDVMREDPTVNRLESMSAEIMGKEAALLVPSGTMGNLVSLMAHGGHGQEVLLDEEAHIYWYEQGGLCSIAGYCPKLIPSNDGIMDPSDIDIAIRSSDIHYPESSLLCLENTHNRGGGRTIPPDLFAMLCQTGKRHGLSIHLDGARIFNAAVAYDVDVKTFSKHVDSVQFCLSKGLSAPVGSIVAGNKEFIGRARRARKRIGGGMRQAGIIAAAGIVALQEGPKRLQHDHANAQLLASLIQEIDGFNLAKTPVTSNMVFLDHSAILSNTEEIVQELGSNGLLVGAMPPLVRLVTNRMVNEEDMRGAARILATVAAKYL